MPKKKSKKKYLLIVSIFVFILVVSFYSVLRLKLKAFSDEISGIQINDIDLLSVGDGVYTGNYYVNESVGAIVEVTISNNKITNIEFVKHDCGRGKKAEVITDLVIEKQSLDVDTISGATGSSTVILKAIENALSSE